ncbi:MAG: class I SAM-dependent methyltransferase [Anaerolineae bacterium]|nr:class I SAM-dependent methyltransferase [Anaerolineae bacterium]
MTDPVVPFYDQLADAYHLLFADWDVSIERQAVALDRLIRARTAGSPLTVLDCACGIGTQAIGLARRGYTVHATDISPAAVARLEREAASRGVTLAAGVADFRTLAGAVTGPFDVVLACDNALPHLITDDDLARTAQQLHSVVREGGLLLVSIRDYDHLTLDKPRATMPWTFDDSDGRRVVFQVWDWAENGQTYDLTLFILRASGDGWLTQSFRTTYRALLRADLNRFLADAGFSDIRWHMPQDTGYYQPVVTARA